MIRTTSRQVWEIGQQVKVGFLSGLHVIDMKAVKDGLPDMYLLERNGKLYQFIPHNGLSGITQEEWEGL